MQNFPGCPKKKYTCVALADLGARVHSSTRVDAHYPAIPQQCGWGPQESLGGYQLLTCLLPEIQVSSSPSPDFSASHVPGTSEELQ